jgi:hypothetical protein
LWLSLYPPTLPVAWFEVIKDIRFQMGMIDRPPHGDLSAADQEAVLDAAERERIDEALCPLQDAETKEIVRRIMIKGASAKRP